MWQCVEHMNPDSSPLLLIVSVDSSVYEHYGNAVTHDLNSSLVEAVTYTTYVSAWCRFIGELLMWREPPFLFLSVLLSVGLFIM